MKSFSLMILSIALVASAFLLSMNGRFQISTYQGSGSLGGMTWMRIDTFTGRAWEMVQAEDKKHWTEIVDYGYRYTGPKEDNS